ncbi:MAG: NDP-sugar synthase [Thermoplasmata archaeon YP2-bin.285]|uniref:Bifunctional protein GlmU n=2 Tax=Candidatus Sysuiplasma superficiale TaxID=2823368 RepID=A0A8J7YPS6_9ARCH|nr:NDP-sugar synthase [Candidatus Sysuiplasma superficiale]
MKAIVMAAGKGTRLLPITATRPKPMIPLLNEPIMDNMMSVLRNAGIDEAVILVDYLSDRIVNHLGDGKRFGMKIDYTTDNIRRGTAGAVRYAAREMDEPFVVVSADVLTTIDLRKLIKAHEESDARITMALSTVSDPSQYGVAILDGSNRITRFQEKPRREEAFSNLVNAGMYICDPEIVKMIPDNTPFDFSRDLFPRMLSEGELIGGYAFDGYWNDVGLPSTYLGATRDMIEGRVEGHVSEITADEDEITYGRIVTGSNCSISASVQIDGFAVLGDNVVAGKNVRISHSIIYSNTLIGDNSVISDAIVGEGVILGRDVTLDEGVVIGDRTKIGEGSRIGHNIKIWVHSRLGPGTKMLHT